MRWPILLLLALVASVAVATAQDYVDAPSSDCWSCHTPADEFPMGDGFDIDPGVTPVTAEVRFRPMIVDPWQVSLSGLSLTVDLGSAPDIAFQGDRPPEDWQANATIRVDATATEGTQTALTRTHTTHVDLPLPQAASGLRIIVAPEGDPGTADLRLSIYGAGQRRPFATLDAAGSGEAEVFSVDEAAVLAEHPGPWRLEASLQVVDATTPRIDPQATDVPVTFTARSWFNASSERSLTKTSPANLTIAQAAAFPFDLLIGDAEGQRIDLIGRARLYYEHDTPTGQDEAFILVRKEVPVEASEEGLVLGQETVARAITPTRGLPLSEVSEAIGYAAAFLMAASMISGGIFGKASRRSMNRIFRGARRRVAFHNFLSYGIIVAAFAHMVIFLVESQYQWTAGLIWGGAGILMLLMLGVTGALQVPIIRRWDYATWRWTHFAVAMLAVALTVAHILLDGAHFGDLQRSIGWQDPFA